MKTKQEVELIADSFRWWQLHRDQEPQSYKSPCWMLMITPQCFSQAVYEATLPENSPLDTVVMTVSATDADEGSEWSSNVMNSVDHKFHIAKQIFSF